MWTEDHLRLLISEQKNRNSEYHSIIGNRMNFWDSILICQYIAGNNSERQSKVETPFDMIHNSNIAMGRAQERCRNRTPPPTYDELTSMIGSSCRESSAEEARERSSSVVDRRIQRQSPYISLTRDEININTNNLDVRNPKQNIKTIPLQPPPL
ncbi:10087_t:CDS:2 [Diversispora eburnea]|uniref:10087_t:CDS:1 n=1 Tax=Diversispora eburnea TaxID=1213867 RepID=A0A9N9FL53_9GLOM|nr:10087_t:CDS:2 [Diversispora eburnea]